MHTVCSLWQSIILEQELFETNRHLPNVKSFYKEYELYRCGHKQNGELLVNYPENYGYLNQISDLIPTNYIKRKRKEEKYC